MERIKQGLINHKQISIRLQYHHHPSPKVYIASFKKMHLTHRVTGREDISLSGVPDQLALKISVGDQLKQSNTHLSCLKRSSLSCGGMDRSCGQWMAMACPNPGAMRVYAPTTLTEPARFLRTRAPTGHDTLQFLPPPGSAEAVFWCCCPADWIILLAYS